MYLFSNLEVKRGDLLVYNNIFSGNLIYFIVDKKSTIYLKGLIIGISLDFTNNNFSRNTWVTYSKSYTVNLNNFTGWKFSLNTFNEDILKYLSESPGNFNLVRYTNIFNETFYKTFFKTISYLKNSCIDEYYNGDFTSYSEFNKNIIKYLRKYYLNFQKYNDYYY